MPKQGSLKINHTTFKKDFIQQEIFSLSGIVTVLDLGGLQE